MSLIAFVGILGAILLLIAWIPQTLRTIKTKRVGADIRFLYLLFLGSLLLTSYSVLISDYIFLFLNFAATVFGGINLYYYEKYEKKKVKDKIKGL